MRIKGNKRENKEIGIKAKAEQKGRPKFMKRQTRKKKKKQGRRNSQKTRI